MLFRSFVKLTRYNAEIWKYSELMGGWKKGEAYVKTVKRQLKAGLVNEWQTWVINNLLKEKVYEEWKDKMIVRLTSERKFVSTVTKMLHLKLFGQGSQYLFLLTTTEFICVSLAFIFIFPFFLYFFF